MSDLKAQLDRIEEMLRTLAQAQAPQSSEILTRAEAKAYVKRPSEGAFSEWCHENHVKPYRRGRYSKSQLDLALSREARKRG